MNGSSRSKRMLPSSSKHNRPCLTYPDPDRRADQIGFGRALRAAHAQGRTPDLALELEMHAGGLRSTPASVARRKDVFDSPFDADRYRARQMALGHAFDSPSAQAPMIDLLTRATGEDMTDMVDEADYQHRAEAAKRIRGDLDHKQHSTAIAQSQSPSGKKSVILQPKTSNTLPVDPRSPRSAGSVSLGVMGSQMIRSRSWDERNIQSASRQPPTGPIHRRDSSITGSPEVDRGSPASNDVDFAKKRILSFDKALRSVSSSAIPRNISSSDRRPHTASAPIALRTVSPTSRRLVAKRQSMMSLTSATTGTSGSSVPNQRLQRPLRALPPPATPPSGPLPSTPSGNHPLSPIMGSQSLPPLLTPPPSGSLPSIPTADPSRSPFMAIQSPPPPPAPPPSGSLPSTPTANQPLPFFMGGTSLPPPPAPSLSGPVPSTLVANYVLPSVPQDQSSESPLLRQSPSSFQLGEAIPPTSKPRRRDDQTTSTLRMRPRPSPMVFKPLPLAPEMSSLPKLDNSPTMSPRTTPRMPQIDHPTPLEVQSLSTLSSDSFRGGSTSMQAPPRFDESRRPSTWTGIRRQPTQESLVTLGDTASVGSSEASGTSGFRRRVRPKTPAVDISDSHPSLP